MSSAEWLFIAVFGTIIVLTAVWIVVRYRLVRRFGSEEKPLPAVTELELQMAIGKKELEMVFDTIPEEICVIDKEYKVVRANRSCAEALGLPIQELIGKTCYQLLWGKNVCCAECPARQAFATRAPVLRKQITHGDRERIVHYEISVFPVMDNNGDVYHCIEIRKDCTDEKRIIEHLVRSEKLASIGTMTAGLAHEMNNPLSGISGNAANLLRIPEKYGLNEKGVVRVTAILNLATRATAIMTDLLHLSQRPEQQFVQISINDLLLKTINSLHFAGSQDIERIYHFDRNLPLLYCDPSKIQQVIMHLMTNAMQAIAEKKQRQTDSSYRGSVSIATRSSGNDLVITFTDNGCGIPEMYRTKVFDPFFSTKPTGQGTGLGLSVSNKIIEEHGGKIFFECVNSMTIFSVQIPFQPNRISQP